jgi:hypothetical protein
MSFKEKLTNELNDEKVETLNGATAYATTNSKVLDFFGVAGSSRGKDILPLFINALNENEELAIRALLWLRDVRGGAGERQQFRNLLLYLEEIGHNSLEKIIPMIPEIGRWDDLLIFKNIKNKSLAFYEIYNALKNNNELCAKWMPRKGKIAVELRNYLDLSPKKYRSLLVSLSNTAESKMCNKEWNKIDYSKLPSLCASRNQKAFKKNDTERYQEYLNELSKPKEKRDKNVKINSGTLYPYDIIKSFRNGGDAIACNAQWDELNFENDVQNVLPVIDVSGSMNYKINKNLTCMDISISLGMFLAMKQEGPFKNVYMTFSERSKIGILPSENIVSNYATLKSEDWGYSTNIDAAFNNLLNFAIKNNIKDNDMPKIIVILSDMQFNPYKCNVADSAYFDRIREIYFQNNYTLPTIVFWNLDSYGTFNCKSDNKNVVMLSGFSPSSFEFLMKSGFENVTPEGIMIDTLMKDRYNYLSK